MSLLDQPTMPSAAEVMKLVGLAVPSESVLNLAQQRSIAARLDAIDIGFEPDRRYGSIGTFRTDTRLALFEAPSGGPVDPTRTSTYRPG